MSSAPKTHPLVWHNRAKFTSPASVIAVTAITLILWHKYDMHTVGTASKILKVSSKLKKSLMTAGIVERYPSQHYLFREDQDSLGVFLVLKGKVCMSLKDLDKLDRIFSAGSLLGIPATFTGHPYSLAAFAVTDAEVVHVERQAFLDLMTGQTELCREATDMLSREVSFIQSALARRRRQ